MDIVHNDKLLAERIAKGDETAFALLFNQYQAKIFTVCKMYIKIDALAEEALQEIFMKVWINRSKLSEVKDPESWLFIVAKNYLIDFLEKWARSKAAEKLWIREDRQDSDEYETTIEEYQQLLASAVKSLSTQQQEVFRLSKEEQLTYKQIGQRLSISPLTVRTHLHRAMQQIRQYISNHPAILSFILVRILTLP
ncbi:MAG: sigma-70 family RNA polymerase sigma factor [Chitinophagaceae bacterium]|nr:sigma-70 family RNA polymerase sigma factor [Chitinophagaceae bacterium]